MNETPRGEPANDELLEAIFRHAEPRPRPDAAARDQAFARLHADWTALVSRRRRRRLAVLGLAASGLFAVVAGALWFDAGSPPLTAPPDVRVLRASGGVELNGEFLGAGELGGGDTILATGDRLETRDDARVALSWGSGSLRLDASTSIELLGQRSLRLDAGSLYFDSTPFDSAAAQAASLVVDTPFGRLTHTGTQFLAAVSGSELTVSVREGEVRIRGSQLDVGVGAGQALWFAADGRFERRLVAAYDPAWQWAAEIAPEVDLTGRTTGEVFAWIARETGRSVRYASDEARRLAASETRGLGALAPMPALRTIPVMTSLHYTLSDGSIVVDVAGGGTDP